MKLASLRNGRPDGHLVIVSRDLTRFASAGRIASNLQDALDDWSRAAPILQAVSDQLNNGEIAGMPFEPREALAPLPRAYQWIDGSGFMVHLDRVRSLKGSKDAELQDERPLLYQGGSDSMAAPTDPILVPSDDLAVDFEAEVVVVTAPVHMRASREDAQQAIRLVGICNDVSLRRLVAGDLQEGFGFFHSKPATSFAPIFVTPDELGDAWRDNRLHMKVRAHVNDSLYGQPNAGKDVRFDFADLIVEATRTRALGNGTIIGSGTVANAHEDILPLKRDGIGFGCIAEARIVEKIKIGKARTPFLKSGDRVHIEAVDAEGRSVFGAIDQKVTLLGS
ncbi:fumarylacetoacetate hydrolase family protein [Pelagibacterium xiamenense]|uniref:fumarylacetoacetate hydrolase family protein n=1 Tax=Pelagibacterium xiamenense TaxID=2901140 RepID=UPI001E310412|nr:fumarylacetoacetate hydrolase family protein [Pelagibacterium xiamenense]MCD7059609.1 fumarylacetoacetate hydrolase family protein [Pelagibacterium xiamenense]